jgi:hypothetical protein
MTIRRCETAACSASRKRPCRFALGGQPGIFTLVAVAPASAQLAYIRSDAVPFSSSTKPKRIPQANRRPFDSSSRSRVSRFATALRSAQVAEGS